MLSGMQADKITTQIYCSSVVPNQCPLRAGYRYECDVITDAIIQLGLPEKIVVAACITLPL